MRGSLQRLAAARDAHAVDDGMSARVRQWQRAAAQDHFVLRPDVAAQAVAFLDPLASASRNRVWVNPNRVGAAGATQASHVGPAPPHGVPVVGGKRSGGMLPPPRRPPPPMPSEATGDTPAVLSSQEALRWVHGSLGVLRRHPVAEEDMVTESQALEDGLPGCDHPSLCTLVCELADDRLQLGRQLEEARAKLAEARAQLALVTSDGLMRDMASVVDSYHSVIDGDVPKGAAKLCGCCGLWRLRDHFTPADLSAKPPARQCGVCSAVCREKFNLYGPTRRVPGDFKEPIRTVRDAKRLEGISQAELVSGKCGVARCQGCARMRHSTLFIRLERSVVSLLRTPADLCLHAKPDCGPEAFDRRIGGAICLFCHLRANPRASLSEEERGQNRRFQAAQRYISSNASRLVLTPAQREAKRLTEEACRGSCSTGPSASSLAQLHLAEASGESDAGSDSFDDEAWGPIGEADVYG